MTRALCAAGVALTLLVVASSTGDVTRAAGLASEQKGGLETSILDPISFPGELGARALRQSVAAGATQVRLVLSWSAVAPWGETKPRGFDARDPGDALYQWTAFDKQVKQASSLGLAPAISIVDAPPWAQEGKKERAADGPVRPNPAAYADFATAAARRYSGSFGDLPRVRLWQVWNEPNLSIFLMPQIVDGKAVSPAWYRAMVSAMARAVHAVRRDNVVIAGGLAPYGGIIRGPDRDRHQERLAPLAFMRAMLCMSRGANPRPTCSARAEFDVWSHHPYTYGDPTTKALGADDVSLGDLDEMRALLEAAENVGHIRSRSKIGFWVTEFSYDSQPGDPQGLEPALHARWVSEALYRMWNDGVTLVTWFLIRDQPFPQAMFQSGLYTVDNKPKPALRAFRFPFVAFRERGASISYWGRTPASARRPVVIEQKTGSRWRRVAIPAVDRYGIFQGKISSRGVGPLRARLANGRDVSVSFGLKVPKNFRFCPWGSGC